MLFAGGTRFGGVRGEASIGGLKIRRRMRLRLSKGSVEVAQELQIGMRVRHGSQAPEGAIWVIEDFPCGPEGGGAWSYYEA